MEIVHATLHLLAGFRIPDNVVAGAPVTAEFFVRNSGLEAAYVAAGGDRIRGRPDFFRFSARVDGRPLGDPASNAGYFGGPMGLVTVAPGDAYEEPILLNQFVRFEDAVARLAAGGQGELELICERRLPCGTSEAAALDIEAAPVVTVRLSGTLVRDDSALTRTLDDLTATILHGPIQEREPALAAVFASRGLAREQLLRLAAHADAGIAERARGVLARLGVER
jgi:hypothetical protein